MIVFNTRYGFMRWAAYFALCFWRLRLKFNSYCASIDFSGNLAIDPVAAKKAKINRGSTITYL